MNQESRINTIINAGQFYLECLNTIKEEEIFKNKYKKNKKQKNKLLVSLI